MSRLSRGNSRMSSPERVAEMVGDSVSMVKASDDTITLWVELLGRSVTSARANEPERTSISSTCAEAKPSTDTVTLYFPVRRPEAS